MKLLFRILFLCVSVAWSGVAHSQDGTVFSLVRDASELKDGDVVVIADPDAKVALGKEMNSAHNGIYSTNIAVNGEEITINDDVQVFQLESSSSEWLFSTGTSYLGSSKENELSFYDDVDEYKKAKIIIENNLANIYFSNGKYRIGYNSGNRIFKLYTATIGNVSLYKKKQTMSSTSIILDGNSQDADNSDAINSYLNKTVDQVTLQRSFVGDGGWYTLCLPFALTSEDIKGQFQGADFQEFTGMTLNTDNSSSLNFKRVTETKAGVPYMVHPINGSNIQNPVFTNKTIEVDQPATVTHRCENTTSYECSFTGIFNPTDVHDRTIRFISADGVTLKMAAVGDNSKLKGFRAYIKLPSESTAAKINCVDTTNGITTIKSDAHATKTGVYDLCGRYIGPSAEGLEHGVYIVNGRKTMIK